MKKAISVLILFLCTLLTISACGPAVAESTPASQAPSESSTEVSYDQYGREYVSDGIGEMDFEGEDVVILVRQGALTELEFFSEGYNNEILNDAIWNRNAAVEERLGVNIKTLVHVPTAGSYAPNDFNARVMNDIESNVAEYDIIASYGYYGVLLANNDLMYNMKEIEHIDFTKPWWNQGFVEEMTLNDKLFFAIGDASFTSVDYTCGVFFNTDLAETYLERNLYEMVDNNQWTLDEFGTMIKSTYRDDGNGTVGEEDFFAVGMATASVPLDALFMGSGLSITEKNGEGIPELTFYNEQTTNFFTKMESLLFNNPGVLPGHYTGESIDLMKEKFENKETVFLFDTLYSVENLRSVNFDYGMLPIPKADANQEEYYTCTTDNYSILSVPTTVAEEDLEKIGATLELLSAESYRTVIPEYFEVIMKKRYLRNDDNARMYDILLDGIRYNFGVVNSISLNDIQHLVRTVLDARSADFASAYQEKEQAALLKLTELIDMYTAD